jgi:hypothetical protein
LSDEEKWCIYLKYHGDRDKAGLIQELAGEDEGLMSTERVLDKVSQDYEEWARALFWEKAEMNYNSGMGAAKKALQAAEQEVQAAKQEVRDAVRGREKAEQRVAELERKLRSTGL